MLIIIRDERVPPPTLFPSYFALGAAAAFLAGLYWTAGHQAMPCPPASRRPTRKKYPGLVNVGNTCYLNSILQCISAIPIDLIPNTHSDGFAHELRSLCLALNTPNSKADVRLLLRAIGNFNKQQQDAQEFLQALLAALQRATMCSPGGLASLLPYDQVEPAWSIWQSVSVLCKCGRPAPIRISTVPMLNLTVQPFLSQSIAEFFAPEPLPDYRCDCGLRGGCFRTAGVVRWPRVLILHFNRLIVDDTGTYRKEGAKVSFPLRMITPPVFTRLPQSAESLYELAAVVEHHGTGHGGHYTAYKRLVDSRQRCVWLHCSDEQVMPVGVEQVLASQAYLLFYLQT